ncbi:penicillin-binding protein 2 [Rhodococcus sp. X156]|uniref:peptidoglycan D,D-transpeptidase FtsI family protein n=1 Tax=Rhodococcus sp. X156 TaxID=2499145 RepID=UPI000FDBC80C|nr:penicillin-binding protein 2 [Rhodococcus sp. X156]
MNKPLRRVAFAVMVLIVALLCNITYIQVFQADSLRADPRNQRVLLDEYSRQRGQISTGGQVLASSEATSDRFKFLRQYPTNPRVYAPITGYYSIQYATTGIERAEDSVLNGSDDRLFGRRLFDLISGRDPRGGNVNLTIDPRVQQTAYDQLTSRGYTGSVVAIRPKTGEILAMVSTPSYDPNALASHDANVRQQAWAALQDDPASPLTNRATSETYPPGSTFKVVTTAAALGEGKITPNSQVTAAPRVTLPGTTTTLENYNGTTCGTGATVTFAEAFARSCNTAFAELGVAEGDAALRAQARALGIGTPAQDIPLPVATSELGPIDDDAALAQSAIGQRDVRVTPLENAVIAATVANGGVRMQPYLVQSLQGPDLSPLGDATSPKALDRAMSPQTAATLTQLMVGAEARAGSGGEINGVQIASKTGTAEHGADPKNTPPHTWYIAFAPAKDPQVAVAVLVENGGNRGLAALGSSVAAPVGRAVIAAALQGVPR